MANKKIRIILAVASAFVAALAVFFLLPNLSKRVDFAYREQEGASKRLLALQGARDGSFFFVDSCNAKSPCECRLYRSENDSEPLIGESAHSSTELNAFFCTVPNNVDPVNYPFVQVKGRWWPVTARIPVSTAIPRNIFFRRLTAEKLRGVFSYLVERTFFEGEGVHEDKIECVKNQHLGVLTAQYHYYAHRDQDGSSELGAEENFPGKICSRGDFLKVKISEPKPILEFGLYKENAPPFITPIQLTASPSPEDTSHIFGYAAAPDANGDCMPGLTYAWLWTAQPYSLTKGIINNNNPSSTFINKNGAYNDHVLATAQPTDFVLFRRENIKPCNKAGNCVDAAFSEPKEVQKQTFMLHEPKICVLPRSLFQGLL